MMDAKNLKRLIVEFTHPGCEYIPKKRGEDHHVLWSDDTRGSGVRIWNELGSHKRKFLVSGGRYITDKTANPQMSKFTYWGEWEAQSHFRHSGLPRGARPQFIHEPYLDLSYDGPRRHNTDPFTYGEHFWYTNCKQKRDGFITQLDNLSVILFGTEFAEGFRLDTVFVVDKGHRPPFSDDFIDSAPQQLKSTNFLHNNLARSPENDYLTFYKSLNYDESPTLFSFVPCRPFSSGKPTTHDRPLLEPWEKFGLQKPGARTVCSRLLKAEMKDGSLPQEIVKKFWNSIVDCCLDQGFSMAVQIDLPRVIGEACPNGVEKERVRACSPANTKGCG